MKTRLRAACRGFAQPAQPPSQDGGVGGNGDHALTSAATTRRQTRGFCGAAGFLNQNLNSPKEGCLMAAVPRQTRAGYLLVRRRALVCFGDGPGATDGPVTIRKTANEQKCRPGHLRNRATRAPLLASQRCLMTMGVEIVDGMNTARWFNGFTCFEKITSND